MRILRAILPLTILLGLASLSGCTRFNAYFNTFYHAKKHYRDAERMVANSKSDRLPPEAVKLYDKSIEKSAKVIQMGGGWWAGVDDAVYLMGAAYYGKKDYDEALRKFDELFLNYPESNHVPEAMYYTGLCYHRKKNYEKADEYFDRIAREYPEFERGDEILFLVGKGFEDDEEDARALVTYERLLAQYPGTKHAEDILQRIGEIHFEDARYDSSLLAYQRLADVTRDDQIFLEASLRAGQSEVRQGKYGEAIRRYESLIPENPRELQDTPRIWIQLAEACNLEGDHDRALDVLDRVIEIYGGTTQGVEALFQMGYTYEVYLEDFDEARLKYEETQEQTSRSVFREEAAERLKNLQQIEELQSKAQSQEEEDQEARAEAAFKVAELLYFATGRKEEALAKYREVERDFPGTVVGARAAYAVAYIQYSDGSTDEDGMDNFRGLIERYPESAQAGHAIEILEEEGQADDALRTLVSDAKERQRLKELSKKMRADSLMRARADSMRLAEEMGASAPKALPDSTAGAAAGAMDDLVGPPAPGGPAGTPMDLLRLQEGWGDTTAPQRSAAWRDSITAVRDSMRAVRDSILGVRDSLRAVGDTVGAVADSAGAGLDSLGGTPGPPGVDARDRGPVEAPGEPEADPEGSEAPEEDAPDHGLEEPEPRPEGLEEDPEDPEEPPPEGPPDPGGQF